MSNSINEQPSPYEPEKALWTEQDFDVMGWHDSFIHGISFSQQYELSLDIDYIFQWAKPISSFGYYKFWVSPCTIVFENLHSLKLDIEISEPFEFEIDDIKRSNPRKPGNADYILRDVEYDWVIETHQGIISFASVGYRQFVRQKPILLESQSISLKERHGVSFERKAYRYVGE